MNPSPLFTFEKQFFSEHSDPFVRSLPPKWLSSFRSYGFMERSEGTLAVTRSRRWSSSRMPAAWFALRPLSSSGLARDGAPTSFPVLQPAAVLYLILYASLPYPQFAPFSFSTPALPDNVGEPYQGNAELIDGLIKHQCRLRAVACRVSSTHIIAYPKFLPFLSERSSVCCL